ncbi:MAG: cell wall metabolism sensor histidine kinase WalK [Candidatus Obscuribacterales bacterium]|nr:cell wall metabolism sensor histidine kinase WalK [Candidatus Obscuribacterales bacterium]
MRLSLNLVSRSIILTAFLIFGQLAFILVLSEVLRDSQEKIEKQWRSENLIRLTFSTCRAFSELLVFAHMPSNLRELTGVDGPGSLARAKRDTESLRTLAAEDPLKRDAVNRLLAANNNLMHPIETVIEQAEKVDTALSFSVPRSYRRNLSQNGNAFVQAVEEIVDIEKQHHAREHSSAQAFSTLTATLVGAVLVSIAMAVVLGFAYAISISRPLKHLSANARLLSAQKQLQAQLSQNDEFGRLDDILHATSREIERTLAQERETIENAADLICALDEDGNFLTVNPFARKMLGIAPEDFAGVNLHDLTVVEESLLADEQVRTAVRSSQVRQFELRLRCADGNVADTRWSCLWSQAERKIFCVVRDVTEEKKIEQLKQDFANMISHDLRSPLMAMGNSFTLLKAGVKGQLSADALKRIDLSARNVDKLIVLVNDLLDFQKLKAGKMELILQTESMQSIIRDAAELLEETAREKNVRIELAEGDDQLLCDRNKLLQAAANLISNAIKFSGENGRVSISVQSRDGSIVFSVSDTGPGVPEDFQRRIFEPFEQAPSGKKSEGTGLGLAICKLVVEAHGGTVRAENLSAVTPSVAGSTAGAGSIFTVELPRNGPQAGSDDEASTASQKLFEEGTA